jgi:raffinose/stachyose/melibiose transport system permease protein
VKNAKKNRFPIALQISMVLLGLVFLFPIYLTFVNSLKTYDQVMLHPAALPNPPQFVNYATVWVQIDYLRAFLNTFIITVGSIAGIILVSSLGAYKLVRSPGKLSGAIFLIILSAMVVPFHALMIPLVKVANFFGFVDNTVGIILIYVGFGIPFAVFLYHGFIKGVPIELEEAAAIDGCGAFRTFFVVVFPLLKNITFTVMVLDVLWIWNDFMLPLLLITTHEKRTLTLSYFFYFGQYVNQWHMALAALSMSIVTAIIFYLFAQKYIVKGIADGAIKG